MGNLRVIILQSIMCLGYFHIPSESYLYHSVTNHNTSSLCNPLNRSVTYRYFIIILISKNLAVACKSTASQVTSPAYMIEIKSKAKSHWLLSISSLLSFNSSSAERHQIPRIIESKHQYLDFLLLNITASQLLVNKCRICVIFINVLTLRNHEGVVIYILMTLGTF